MTIRSKNIIITLVVMTSIAIILLGAFTGGTALYKSWQHRNDQTYATCNTLNDTVKNQLSSLFESKTLEAVEYSCGELKGAFPTKTWTIDYYIRGEFEPQKTAADLKNELTAILVATDWKQDQNPQLANQYSSKDNTKELRIEVLSARYNLYLVTVSTTDKNESGGNSSLPANKPWSNEILSKYPPFDLPQLTYSPLNSTWSKPSYVSGEQFIYRLKNGEKVEPSLSVSPEIEPKNDGTLIGTGLYENPIYSTDDKGDYQTTINGVVYALRNLRNLNNSLQLGDDEAIKILNGITFNS